MSKVKIYGNPDPVIGIKEYYSIHDFFGSSSPSKFMEPLENTPDENIKWSVWILLGDTWTKMAKNNKTGATVEYTFTQTSLARKGIRMLVDANGEKAVLDIKTKSNAESKILHVEILDNLGKKPTKLFSYGETITARVHCLNMEKFRINVTLWENDGGKKDLSDISIETKEADVLNGKADVKFTFDTSKVWLANAKTAPGESNEGAFHEYYVTAEFYKKVSKPTQDINVINPDYKVDILSKTSASKPSETETQKTSPVEQKGPSKKETRGIAKKDEKAHDYHEQKIDVKPTANYDPQQEFINSLLMVNVGDSMWNQKKGSCLNCDKDITLDDIKKICVDKRNNCLIEDETMIRAALPYLNIYRKKVGINTCIRKAHFLAQISQESKFYSLQENFNWYWEKLIGEFSSYFNQFQTRREKETEAKRLGRINLAPTPGLTLNQQIKLANAIYGHTHPLGRLHVNPGDGWLYSGKGFKQITWKENYQNLARYFNTHMKVDNEPDVDWTDGDNPYKLKNNPKDAITSALAYWGKYNINSVANENSSDAVTNVTVKINAKKSGLTERQRYFKNAISILKVNLCKSGEEIKIEEGTVVVVSGTDKKRERDPAQNIYWMMYKTSVYQNMSLDTYKKLKASNELPLPDYTTYLSRDTHQVRSSNGAIFRHSIKRFGQYNEIPPGEYFLVPGLDGQKYRIYVIDSESKIASSSNGIDGIDGERGGIALHQYCPRFSVGCFTFNSGRNTTPIQNFINNIPDLVLEDNRPVRFIVESRDVEELVWENDTYGTKKWKGI
ncbi:hypothetical protein BSF41_47310 [Flavobacterium sp. ACN2]|jgi:predicted chitinase|nr:hypothetical protein BSF41_47310 [Flavobacterium sp. ACN2]